MGRWKWDRRHVVGLVLMGGAIACAGWAWLLEPTERSDALVLPGFVLGLAGFLVGVVPLLAWFGRRPDARPVGTLATLLAGSVDGQWHREARERLLLPEPIPVRWSLSDLAVTGPLDAAVGTPDVPPAFPPLPGHVRITAANSQAGGGRGELHALYAGLASGRLVVTGAPGAGKSGAAILLLLDALAHRASLDDTQRARVPVPVLLTAHGWDPNTCSARDWLADRLAATYPLFQHRGGRTEAAALVAARDKVALILDGLDEMDEALRPAALQALSDAPFRVVVLTRSQELIRATSRRWLAGAAAVHLHDIPAADAATYLHHSRTGPHPAGWTELLAHLRAHPDGVLARGLSTPLTLTLLRDTYQAGDNAGELLDTTGFPTTEAIERHLIARVLPAAYTPQPGRSAPRYTEQQAHQALTFIAHQMGKDRDLAWWHIPRWAPVPLRSLATQLVVGLPFGLVGWLVGAIDFWVGLWVGIPFGFLFGGGGRAPERVRIANWRAGISRPVLRGGLVLGFWFGLVGGLVYGLTDWFRSGFRSGLGAGIGGLSGGLAAGLVTALVSVLIEGGAGESSPLGPRESWHNDRKAGIVGGLAAGVSGGLATGLFGALKVGLETGLTFGLIGGLTLWLTVGLIYPETWPTTLAWLQLQRSGHVPAVSLMPFLEDAHDRGVLRTSGTVYQFRHSILQDQLASQAASNPSTSSTVQRASRTR